MTLCALAAKEVLRKLWIHRESLSLLPEEVLQKLLSTLITSDPGEIGPMDDISCSEEGGECPSDDVGKPTLSVACCLPEYGECFTWGNEEDSQLVVLKPPDSVPTDHSFFSTRSVKSDSIPKSPPKEAQPDFFCQNNEQFPQESNSSALQQQKYSFLPPPCSSNKAPLARFETNFDFPLSDSDRLHLLLLPQLHSLRFPRRLIHCNRWEEALELLPFCCPELSEFEIATSSFPPCDSFAWNLLVNCPLKHLSICGCSTFRELITGLGEGGWRKKDTIKGCNLKSSHQLQNLCLKGCSQFCGESLYLLAPTCFSNLRVLNCKGCYNILDTVWSAVAKHTPLLEVLNIADCDISDNTLENFALAAPPLSALNISWSVLVTDNGVISIATACSQTLCSFKSRSCPNISTATVSALSELLGDKLVTLDVSRCDNITDNVGEILSYHCTSLEKLSLSWLDITDDTVNRLLKSCCLRFFRLVGCKMLSGNEWLSALPLYNAAQSLELLDLSWCNYFSCDTLQELIRELPNLIVLDYYGESVKLKVEEEGI